MRKVSNWKSKNQPDIFIPTQKKKKIVQSTLDWVPSLLRSYG